MSRPADPFDPENLRLTTPISTPKTSARPPHPRAGQKFLKGPIPWDWLEAAARLPGKAVAVGNSLWFLAGCLRRRTVPLNLSAVADRLGVHQGTASRWLRLLEAAGLVEVVGIPGRCLTVTILEHKCKGGSA
jgi:hypothetical protein